MWWASGFQSISPLRGPFRCRQGKLSPAALNALTTAEADPVASKAANRSQSAADGGIGVEDDVPGGVVDQPDRQRGDQLTAAGLGHDPAAQPGPDEMQLGFLCGHRRYADHAL